jgi:hypothetical protein
LDRGSFRSEESLPDFWSGCESFERLRDYLGRLQTIRGGCKSFGAAANRLGRLQIIWGGCRLFGTAANHFERLTEPRTSLESFWSA